MASIIRDGRIVEVGKNEVHPEISLKDRLLRAAAKNILNAPAQGFEGPKVREIFHGNR